MLPQSVVAFITTTTMPLSRIQRASHSSPVTTWVVMPPDNSVDSLPGRKPPVPTLTCFSSVRRRGVKWAWTFVRLDVLRSVCSSPTERHSNVSGENLFCGFAPTVASGYGGRDARTWDIRLFPYPEYRYWWVAFPDRRTGIHATPYRRAS